MSDTMGDLLGAMPPGMLTQPQNQATKKEEPKTIKKRGNLVVTEDESGKKTYYPSKFYAERIGFESEYEAKKAASMSIEEAASMASGAKSYLSGDSVKPSTAAAPDPTGAKPAEEAPIDPRNKDALFQKAKNLYLSGAYQDAYDIISVLGKDPDFKNKKGWANLLKRTEVALNIS